MDGHTLKNTVQIGPVIFFFKEKIEDKVEWLGKWGVDPGGVGESNYDQNALCKILKELIKNYPKMYRLNPKIFVCSLI